MRLIPQAVPRLTESTIDGRVLALALLASMLTAFLFGLAPAISLWSVNPQDVLKDGTRTTSRSLRSRRLLVAVELALAVVLLSGAGLMVKSFSRMHAHPPGFNPERILTVKVMFTVPQYVDIGRRRAFVEDFIRRVQLVPGVEAVSMTTGGASPRTAVIVEWAPPKPTEGGRRPTTALHAASAAYAQALGLRLERGRWFTDTELQPAVVITQSVARREFGSADPLGRRIQLPPARGQAPTFAPVVGVVADLKYSKLDADPDPEIYIPYRHHPSLLRFTAMIRTTDDPLSLAPTIRTVLSDIDKTQAVFDVTTLERALADTIAPRRFNLFLLGTFAGTALLLALIGTYGLIAYWVSQRTQEIGVRMAIGARHGHVIKMVLREGMSIAFAGIVAGLIGAFALTRLMAGLLYDVEATDPQTFAVVTGVISAAALVACGGPALKAARVDPVIALRYE